LLGDESPRTIFNFKSTTFKKTGIDETSLSDADLMSMLSEEPRFFRRPIAVVDGRIFAGINAKQLSEELGFDID
jgi:arsenate reductase-like glutaredoxin family protein